MNKRTGAYYIFGCNSWFAQSEEDKKIERILELNATPRLEIAVKHGAPGIYFFVIILIVSISFI